MLLSGFAACFLLVVLMRPTSPSSQHRSCMMFQNKEKTGPDYQTTVINENDIVYFHGATELSWGIKDGDNGERSRYHVESKFKPELLNSDNPLDNSAERSTLDILKDKFNSLSLDTCKLTTVEEIWREYDHFGGLDFSTADHTSKDNSKPYIGRKSDVVLKFQNGQNQDLEPFQPGDRIEANYKGQGEWYPAKFDGEHDTPGFYKVTYDDLPNREGRTKKEDVRHMAKHDYLVFGNYYNPLNLAPCKKCNESGKVAGRMWGKNKCPACKGRGETSLRFKTFENAKRKASKVDAFIEFLTKEKGISRGSSNRGAYWVH